IGDYGGVLAVGIHLDVGGRGCQIRGSGLSGAGLSPSNCARGRFDRAWRNPTTKDNRVGQSGGQDSGQAQVTALCLPETGWTSGGVGIMQRPLKAGEGGPYGELSARPLPDGLAVVFMPSLAALLDGAERIKGSPLSEEQVLRIRDAALVVVAPADVVALTVEQ